MSKIKTITVSNLKAISQQTANFDGCTAIVTGRNNAGKTSFLRGLFDRVRGNKAEQPLKQGETEGFAEAELTTGEKLRWEFNDKGKGFKEKLTYITEKDIKTSLSVELRNRFLPETFDVDTFLASQPKKQRETLQLLAGLDFTDIDSRYSEAYKERTAANTLASEAKTVFENMVMPVKVEAILQPELDKLHQEKQSIRTKLNNLYTENKSANDAVRLDHDKEVKKQEGLKRAIESTSSALGTLNLYGYTGKEVQLFIAEIQKLVKPEIPLIDLSVTPNHIKKDGEFILIKELPDDKEIVDIDAKIQEANDTNTKAAEYTKWLDLQTKKDTAATAAIEANNKVVLIEKERINLIKTANMPEGFTFTDEGIAYNGLAFTREQLSSSGIYIAALKLASMNIGEIRTLHFDASFLDKNSLVEIEQWATSQDLQLLIERPDFEGGEIEYQLICN